MKTLNLILWLFALVTSSAYLIYIVRCYGVQRSISATYRNLEGPVKKTLYSWFIFCVALPTMILSNNTWGFWAGAFLMLDFAAPTGQDKMTQFFHNLGAQVGMGLAVAMMGFAFGQWYLVVPTVIAVFLIAKLKVKNSTWHIETLVLWVVLLGLFLEKILCIEIKVSFSINHLPRCL